MRVRLRNLLLTSLAISQTASASVVFPARGSRSVDLSDSATLADVETAIAAGSLVSAGDISPLLNIDLHLWLDPSGGDDGNTGIGTSSSANSQALKTAYALGLRIRGLSGSGRLTVHVAGDVPRGDALRHWFFPGARGKLTVVGETKAALATGTIGTLVALDDSAASGGQAWEVVDPGLSGGWGQYVRRRVVLTSGACEGMKAVILKDLGTGRARLSEFGFVDTDFVVTPPLAEATPAEGDTFAIEDLHKVSIGNLTAIADGPDFGSGNSQDAQVWLAGLDIISLSSGSGSVLDPSMRHMYIVDCTLNGVAIDAGSAEVTVLNCGLYQSNVLANRAGTVNVLGGGMIDSSVVAGPGGVVLLGPDTCRTSIQGGNVQCRGGRVHLGDVMINDVPGGDPGVLVDSGLVSLDKSFLDAGRVFGNVGTGRGIVVNPGAPPIVDFGALTPNLTGDAGDFTLGYEVTGTAKARTFDETQGATASYSDVITCTWANYALAKGSGGFGGTALVPSLGTGIVRRLS